MKLGRIHNYIRDLFINKKKRTLLDNKNFSIICNDCVGGMVLHDFKMEFRSPTVNMWCSASDYVKFISDLKSYLELEPKYYPNDDYPIMMIGDIMWHCIHYKSFDEAKQKWQSRKGRINFNNLYFLFNDRNGCTYKELEAFENLPFKHKVCFTHVKYPEFKSTFYIPGSENKECLEVLTSFLSKFSLHRRYDSFNFVDFFNE